MRNLVICSGSRSGPLAIAAGGMEEAFGVNTFTGIDERSAAFLGLGLSTAISKASVVVTTSGTAVSNLLPAAVEADRSCQPIIFITADRPSRLKNCGSNQTVNQEDFLLPACRSRNQGPLEGIHLLNHFELTRLVEETWNSAHDLPGPVHLNLAIEEPLHANYIDQKAVWNGWEPDSYREKKSSIQDIKSDLSTKQDIFYELNPSRSGIVVVGPWRGTSNNLRIFNDSLKSFQLLTGWPIFADPLSGVDSNTPGIIRYWDILISIGLLVQFDDLQVLRLGPLPTSKNIEEWLKNNTGKQVLITEGETRPLDPIRISFQSHSGLASWYTQLIKLKSKSIKKKKTDLVNKLSIYDQKIDKWLDKNLSKEDFISEPSLAHWLPRLLPKNIPIMLSASSPIRDWITYSGSIGITSRCFGFRGASGIDGTLSLAIGLSNAIGRLVLVCGDLSLLHDTNGWLFAKYKAPSLIIFLIDNAGGGIFNQLEIDRLYKGDFERLFIMKPPINPKRIAEAYQIPTRDLKSIDDIKDAIEWCFTLSGPVVLRVSTDSTKDFFLRKKLSYEIKQYIYSLANN